MWDSIWPYLAAILPTIVVAVLFYFLMKSILEGDRRERIAQSQWESEQNNSPRTNSALIVSIRHIRRVKGIVRWHSVSRCCSSTTSTTAMQTRR